MKIRSPDAGGEQPGGQTAVAEHRAAEARRLQQQERARPAASPSSVLIAAKLPVGRDHGGRAERGSRATSRTASTPARRPSAISGASGPSETPRPSVASAASAIPGISIGGIGPDALKPSAGEWPPVPGR